MSRPKQLASDQYIVVIPAYNEEGTIVECLNHISDATKLVKNYQLKKIVICINGCTDRTESLVRSWSNQPIEIIHSEPGYLNAMNKLNDHVRAKYPNLIMIKTDADGAVAKDSFKILFNQLEKHEELIVAGGFPTPLNTLSKNPYTKIMSKILSIRSRVPESEITVRESSDYHQYADIDPIDMLKGREKKLKIYFHGRLWCIRSTAHLPDLPNHVIGEDVFLPGWILKNYGKKSMRLDYRAKVYFHPNHSLRRHWMVYRRVFEDRKIVYSIPGLQEYAYMCPLKLDWSYILFNCKLNDILQFIIYRLIVRVENISFKMIKYNEKFWQYESKET